MILDSNWLLFLNGHGLANFDVVFSIGLRVQFPNRRKWSWIWNDRIQEARSWWGVHWCDAPPPHPHLSKGPLLATKWAKNEVFVGGLRGWGSKNPLFGSERSTFWGSCTPHNKINPGYGPGFKVICEWSRFSELWYRRLHVGSGFSSRVPAGVGYNLGCYLKFGGWICHLLKNVLAIT